MGFEALPSRRFAEEQAKPPHTHLPHSPSSLDSCCRTARAIPAKNPIRCCCCCSASGCCWCWCCSSQPPAAAAAAAATAGESAGPVGRKRGVTRGRGQPVHGRTNRPGSCGRRAAPAHTQTSSHAGGAPREFGRWRSARGMRRIHSQVFTEQLGIEQRRLCLWSARPSHLWLCGYRHAGEVRSRAHPAG